MQTLTTTFDKIRQAVYARGFVYNVGVLAGGTALAQAISVLAAPILSRLYTPDDFGALGVFTSIFSILLAVNSLRYEFAISLPIDEDDAANLLVLTLALVVVTTILFEIALALLADPIITWTNAPALRPYLWLIPLSLLGAGFYQGLNYWAIRRQQYAPIARTRFTQSLAGALTPVLVGLVAGGPVGLLVGHVIGQMTGSGSLAWLAWRDSRAALRRVSLHGMAQMAGRYYRFPLIATWSSLLNSLGLSLPQLLLSTLFGTMVTGWFLFGQRIIAIPMTLIGASVGQVFLGTISKLKNDAPDQLKPFYLKTARRLFLLGLVPSLFLLLTGAPLFGWVFGEEWRTAGLYAQILAPMFLVQVVVSSLSQVMTVLERQSVQLVWDLARLVLLAVVLVGAAGLGGTAVVVFYSASMTAAYLVLFGLQWRALGQFAR
ncbi:MAG: oligosaccharide flippase family protein [Chloroflexi bacterium]|nr:oligosaccharide flippase family protein [Chloroflexota bacterium]